MAVAVQDDRAPQEMEMVPSPPNSCTSISYLESSNAIQLRWFQYCFNIQLINSINVLPCSSNLVGNSGEEAPYTWLCPQHGIMLV